MTSEIAKSKIKNGVTERAKAIGLQSVDEFIEEDRFIIKMTPNQKDKAESLCDFMGVSWGTLINIAIKSAISYAKAKETKINDLREYPKTLGTDAIEVVLGTKTLLSLEEYEMNDKANECAVTGIKFLHEKLIKNKSQKSQ